MSDLFKGDRSSLEDCPDVRRIFRRQKIRLLIDPIDAAICAKFLSEQAAQMFLQKESGSPASGVARAILRLSAALSVGLQISEDVEVPGDPPEPRKGQRRTKRGHP